jgi:hypothetical protein
LSFGLRCCWFTSETFNKPWRNPLESRNKGDRHGRRVLGTGTWIEKGQNDQEQESTGDKDTITVPGGKEEGATQFASTGRRKRVIRDDEDECLDDRTSWTRGQKKRRRRRGEERKPENDN